MLRSLGRFIRREYKLDNNCKILFSSRSNTKKQGKHSNHNENQENNTEDIRPLFIQERVHLPKQNSHQNKRNRFMNPDDENYKTPNLLTWAEKEKIRELHNKDPMRWPIQRLAGNFPATIPTIRNILKNNWKPEDIGKHDEAVHNHWIQLQNGQYKIPIELKTHLLSFAPRSIPEVPTDNKKIETKTEDKNPTDTIVFESSESVSPESEVIDLNEFNYKITDLADESYLNVSSKTGIAKYERKRIEMPEYTYPERIRIPQDKWKNGRTYKISDCYYHHDGTFLYRVPGMTQ